jgi:predicted nucleic acid-binding Zn ribbon protein
VNVPRRMPAGGRKPGRNATRPGEDGARGPEKMADVVARLLARRGYAQVQAAAVCEEAWRQATGAELAVHSRPGNLRRGVLEVTVRNSTILLEWTFQKKRLLESLSRLAPEQGIRGLRFRVGAVE